MKKLMCFIFFLFPFLSQAEESNQAKRKKNEWHQQFEHRLNRLENTISADIQEVNLKQDRLNKEMIRMNEKLESRFDKYFLWGYGTLLVILSTIVNVVFNKRKELEISQERSANDAS